MKVYALYIECTKRPRLLLRQFCMCRLLPLVICVCLVLAFLIQRKAMVVQSEDFLNYDKGMDDLARQVRKEDYSVNIVEDEIELVDDSLSDEADEPFDNTSSDGMNEQECPGRNFVFIKCMKCATESMATIFRKFALQNKLNVLLPRGNNLYLGWPYVMETADYRPSSDQYYNCLIEHSIYNASVMKPMFPPGTRFISIIREPWSHFKSTFHYFNIQNVVQIVSDTPLSTYLHNISTYELVFKSSESHRICIPNGFSITRNLMSHCLGMGTGFPEGYADITNNPVTIQEYLNWLENEFSLIMIAEYFHESLVLLKRLMCWSMKDIIYKNVNKGKYSYEENVGDRAVYEKWSTADYQLYAFFNETLWWKIVDQGPSFYEELKVFTKVQNSVNLFCNFPNRESSEINIDPMFNVTQSSLYVPQTDFNTDFVFTKDDCQLYDTYLLPVLKKQYEDMNPQFEDKDPPKRNC